MGWGLRQEKGDGSREAPVYARVGRGATDGAGGCQVGSRNRVSAVVGICKSAQQQVCARERKFQLFMKKSAQKCSNGLLWGWGLVSPH